jgi:hypothetical protein
MYLAIDLVSSVIDILVLELRFLRSVAFASLL